MEEISEQGDSFLFLSWSEDEIMDLDVDDDSEEDENLEKLLIFTSDLQSFSNEITADNDSSKDEFSRYFHHQPALKIPN